jgi:phosphoribosylglycinamide formyltransferase-1
MIVVLASGSGSNFQAIAEAFPGEIGAVVCNVAGAGVLARAEQLAIPALVVPHRNFSQRADHDRAVVAAIGERGTPDLVVLAGYMRILTPTYFAEMQRHYPRCKTINLHPAPLDLYKGAHAFEYAVEHRFTRWGVSVHEATPELDSGPLIRFSEFPIFPNETAGDLRARVAPIEHRTLIEAIKTLRSPH